MPARKALGRIEPPEEWALYKQAPGLILGFHGCDRDVAEKVLSGSEKHLAQSENAYDWLGHGIYFWENDPWRALKFAQLAHEKQHYSRGRIRKPYVIGAAIDLGFTFNLMEVSAVGELMEAHEYLRMVADIVPDKVLPSNSQGRRLLDCEVVNTVHALREKRRLRSYQSVRAAFIEGEPAYPGAGFHMLNHIQIAVRSTSCIKGYFRPLGLDDGWPLQRETRARAGRKGA